MWQPPFSLHKKETSTDHDARTKHFRCCTANDAFVALAKRVYINPDFIVAPRGATTKEVLCVSIVIEDPYMRCVTHPCRNFSIRYAIGEWLWYMRASSSLEEIAHYSKFWNKVSDDGITVNSAYGYRMFGNHPKVVVNQWEYAKQELIRDADSRRAVLFIAAPFDLGHPTKDLPCTVYLQFFIRQNRLYLSANMRSNDLVLGFANDVFAFTLFQERMLCELRQFYPKLKMGEYCHFAGSLHIYDRNFEMIEKVLELPGLQSLHPVKLPHMRDLDQLAQLQEEEERIRENKSGGYEFTDRFSRACQRILRDA